MTDKTTKPVTITQYLAALPKDRRDAMQAVRKVIRANLDPKFKEVIQYGAIGYVVPHSVYPAGYHCDPKQPLPFAGIVSRRSRETGLLESAGCTCSLPLERVSI